MLNYLLIVVLAFYVKVPPAFYAIAVGFFGMDYLGRMMREGRTK